MASHCLCLCICLFVYLHVCVRHCFLTLPLSHYRRHYVVLIGRNHGELSRFTAHLVQMKSVQMRWDEMTELYEIFRVYCLWQWFGPALAALRYVTYFRFCGWRNTLYYRLGNGVSQPQQRMHKLTPLLHAPRLNDSLLQRAPEAEFAIHDYLSEMIAESVSHVIYLFIQSEPTNKQTSR